MRFDFSVTMAFSNFLETEIWTEKSKRKKVAKIKFSRFKKIRNAPNLYFFDDFFIRYTWHGRPCAFGGLCSARVQYYLPSSSINAFEQVIMCSIFTFFYKFQTLAEWFETHHVHDDNVYLCIFQAVCSMQWRTQTSTKSRRCPISTADGFLCYILHTVSMSPHYGLWTRQITDTWSSIRAESPSGHEPRLGRLAILAGRLWSWW